MIATVAIGRQYEIEAMRLQRTVNLPIEVFTKSNDKYVEIHSDTLINGLWHKANFANYIDETEEPIVFMDADMFTLTKNPFKNFSVKKDTDFAYVPYESKWWFPDTIRQKSFDYHGHKINSGFMYFKTLKIAKIICTKWAEEFLKRPLHYVKNEYDEYALMIALMQMDYKIELLDRKWNEWELNTEEEIRASDAIFFQSHKHLDII
jgi:hypothetical protein